MYYLMIHQSNGIYFRAYFNFSSNQYMNLGDDLQTQ